MNRPKLIRRELRVSPALLLAIVVPVLFSACATHIPSYDSYSTAPAQAEQAQGLLLKADPFTDKEQTETYFKVNPAEKGIVIIHLRAENHSTDATWLLMEQRMALADNLAQNGAPGVQGIKGDLASANIIGWAGALAGGPLLFQLGYTQTFVEKNFVDKEWRNQTLSPGQSAQGFLYFDAGKPSALSKKSSLWVECVNVRTHQTNIFMVALPYEEK